MTLSRGRARVLLAGVVAAAAVGAVVAMRDGGPTGPVRRPSNGEAATPAPARGASPGVAGLKLDVLDHQPPELAESERNPFRFQPRVVQAPARAAAPPRAVAAAPPVPSGPPPPPAIPLRFIGLMDAPTQAGRMAVLSDGRGNVFYGKEGDIIEGRYRVVRVGADAAELTYVDGRGRQVIRLAGQ